MALAAESGCSGLSPSPCHVYLSLREGKDTVTGKVTGVMLVPERAGCVGRRGVGWGLEHGFLHLLGSLGLDLGVGEASACIF